MVVAAKERDAAVHKCCCCSNKRYCCFTQMLLLQPLNTMMLYTELVFAANDIIAAVQSCCGFSQEKKTLEVYQCGCSS